MLNGAKSPSGVDREERNGLPDDSRLSERRIETKDGGYEVQGDNIVHFAGSFGRVCGGGMLVTTVDFFSWLRSVL